MNPSNQDLARAALQFLARADLKGAEVQAFAQVAGFLDALATGALVAQPAAKDEPKRDAKPPPAKDV